jgi:hypothetical protein
MAGILWNADRDRRVESVRVNIERYAVAKAEGWSDTATIEVPPLSAVRIEAPERPVDVSLPCSRHHLPELRKGEARCSGADRGNSETTSGLHDCSLAINTTEKPLLVRVYERKC